MVIPAAGLGRRFLPLSRVVPKELLLLGDRPLLHHALNEARGGGFEGAVLVTAAWKRPLFEAYLEAAAIDFPVVFIEQEVPAGIGDAVLRAADAADPPFGVLLPDDVVTETAHWGPLRAAPGPALCVRSVAADAIDRYGIVVRGADGQALEMHEKPKRGSVPSNWAILGRYLVTQEVLATLGPAGVGGEVQLTDGFAKLSGTTLVEFRGELYDCGTPESYLAASAAWSDRRRLPGGAEGG